MLIDPSVPYSPLGFKYLLIVCIAHVPQFFQILVIRHILLILFVTFILPNHVAQLVVLILQLDQPIHALL